MTQPWPHAWLIAAGLLTATSMTATTLLDHDAGAQRLNPDLPTHANAREGAIAVPASAPPVLNSSMRRVLDRLAALHGRAIETLTPAEARRQPTLADAVIIELRAQDRSEAPERVAHIAERTIPGPAGMIPVRVYTPVGATNSPSPVLLYFHDGGFVTGSLDTDDATARALANASGAVVVSVQYRLAPEHRFPAASDDAFAAYHWVLDHAGEIHGDAHRVAVAGAGAGGDLATGVALLARARHVRIPVHQTLIHPVVSDGMNTVSYAENANARPLDAAMMHWFFQQYLPSPGDGDNPLVSPIHADLRGMPSTTVITAQIDPLRDEGEAYAARLREAGVPVVHRRYNGVTHGFIEAGAVVEEAREATAFAGRELRLAFARVRR